MKGVASLARRLAVPETRGWLGDDSPLRGRLWHVASPVRFVQGVNVTKTVIAFLALSVLTLYGAERYSALTEEEIAYVYHPGTDNVYAVVFGTTPDRRLKKHLLLPFHAPSREIKIVAEVGFMRSYLREKAAADTLFRVKLTPVSSESATVRLTRSARLSPDSVHAFGYRWAFPDLAWVPRQDLRSLDLLPLELSAILPAPTAGWFWNDVRPVDAVVIKEKLRAPLKDLDSAPNSIEILESAVMIRGEAAKYLDKVLFAEVGSR